MPPSETPLEQAARHVRKGQVHIAAQEAVVRRLERQGPSEQLAEARAVLAQLRDFQVLAADQFGQELRKPRPGR